MNEVATPHCPVCFRDYGPGLQRPWDLGCGHCICQRCYASLATSGRRQCPIDRTAWDKPHVNYELLNFIEALVKARGLGAGGDRPGGEGAADEVEEDEGSLPPALAQLLQQERQGEQKAMAIYPWNRHKR